MRFVYDTDAYYNELGLVVDEIAVDGTTIGTAETAEEGWVLDGFTRRTGQETQDFFNAYIAENRQYDGSDKSLKTAYHFGFGGVKYNWVEDYPYQDGMLVSYWNTEWEDNNVGTHPGEGLVLPVDAHQKFPRWKDGSKMRPRIASFDSTFGLERTDKFSLHNGGKKSKTTVPSARAVPRFDDTQRWWRATDPQAVDG